MLNLDGRRAVFVGGSSGIGFASAQLFHQHGASVTLCGRSTERLEAALQRFENSGRAETLQMDVTDDDSIVSAFSRFDGKAVDYVMVSAAELAHGPFAEQSIADVRAMFDSKFWGTYRVAQAAVPHMRENGAFIFISGVLSRRPGKNCAALGAACSAVEALTRGLALELGPHLRANCIAPGMVRTELHDRVPKERRDAMFASTGSSLPVGRIGAPRDVAEAALLLATNEYMTGQVVDVDGGHTIRQYASR